MRKCSKRLLALLLTCVMVLICGITASASDEGLVMRTKTLAPSKWAVTMEYPKGDEHFYNNIFKVTLPCNGTLTISMATVDGSTVEDEYTDPLGTQTFKDGLFLYKTNPDSNVAVKYYKVLGFGEKSKATHEITLKKGTYYITTGLTVKFKYTFTPSKTAVSSVTNSSSKAAVVKWTKVSGVKGYQIQYSTKSNFSSKKTITVKNASTLSYKIKSLKKGLTYYVRVRTYSTVSGKNCYSKWSVKKTVKIKK